jgi:hypothetical protein
MAASGYTPIILFNSGTTGHTPTTGNLAVGELAINYTDGKLYYNTGSAIAILANAASQTPVTTFSAGTTGFTPSTATSGAVTLSGTLATTNGGTGLTSFTANGVVYASSTSALATGSALSFDGTNLGVGTSSPTAKLDVRSVIMSRDSATANTTSNSFYAGGAYSGNGVLFLNGYSVSGSNSIYYGGGSGSYEPATNHIFMTGTAGTLSSGTEQMRLTSTGLGIGTSSPGVKLHVSGSGEVVGRFQSSQTEVDIQFVTSGSSTNFFGVTNSTDYQWILGNNQLMYLNSSGNLGLGVTPSAWGGNAKGIQITNYGSVSGNSNIGTASLAANAYEYADNGWKRTNATSAGLYQISYTGAHTWSQAVASTANSIISWTQAMTLDNSGNLGIGTTSPSTGGRFVVYGKVSYAGQNQVALFYSQTSGGAVINFQDTASANGSAVGGTGDNLTFYTSSGGGNLTEHARISSSGQLLVGQGASNGYGLLQVAGGIVSGTKSSATGSMYTFNQTNDAFLSMGSSSDGSYHYINSNYDTSAGVKPLRFVMAGSYSSTPAMTITAANYVGIGTSSPSALLQVNGSSGAILITGNTNTSGMQLGVREDGQDVQILNNSSTGGIRLYTNGSERAFIDSSGNLLVGKTADGTTAGIEISPSWWGANIGQVLVSGNSTSNSQTAFSVYTTSSSQYQFYVSYGGNIYARNTSITAISDQTLKTNIKPLETGLTQVLALQPRRFDWLNGDGTNVAGFIAQEVEQVLPDLVSDYQYNDTEKKKAIKMGDMLPTVVKAMQEMYAEIQSLKAEVATLKGA